MAKERVFYLLTVPASVSVPLGEGGLGLIEIGVLTLSPFLLGGCYLPEDRG